MRAITCTGYGRPTEVLRVADVEGPAVADDHVLVGVRAASLNAADWHLVRGVPYVARLSIGLRRPGFEIPGSDVAGVVEAVGRAVTSVQPGDEVYGTTFMAGFGAFAEKVAVPERLVAGRPRTVSFEEAAGIPLAGSTALQALRDHGKVRSGQHVLVIGASGGVGTYAVQLAKHLGATATAVSSTRNLDLVRSLGADHAIDYTTTDVVDTAERYDVILQLAGTDTTARLLPLLTRTGTLLQLSGDSANRWVGPLGRIAAGRIRSRFASQTITTFTVEPNRDDLHLLAALVDDGALRTHLDSTHGLDDVPAALERIEAGRTRGKVAIAIAVPPGRTPPPVVGRRGAGGLDRWSGGGLTDARLRRRARVHLRVLSLGRSSPDAASIVPVGADAAEGSDPTGHARPWTALARRRRIDGLPGTGRVASAWQGGDYVRHAAHHRSVDDWFLAAHPPQPGDVVVDAGCGTGEFTRRLAELVPDGG